MLNFHPRPKAEPASGRSIPLRIVAVAGCALILSATLSPALATAQQPAAAVAQSFETAAATKTFPAGSLVSTQPRNQKTVELASIKNTEHLIGVVATEPLVTIVDNANTVSVVTTGKATVLVSDINGSVRSGDKVTASPIAGVGMKATTNTQVVGTVLADQSSDKASTTRSVKDTAGVAHDIRISRLPIQLGVAYNQLPGNSLVPPIVQRTVDDIAGQPVSAIRILLVGIILLACLASIITLMYSSGRSSITAIGRNPLSASKVYQGMYRVGILALIILVFGTISSVLLLKT